MARPKTNKEIKSISFDKEVFAAMEEKCRKHNVPVSAFVNDLVKRKVMSEYEFYRQKATEHAAEMHKFKTLMETAKDAPSIMQR